MAVPENNTVQGLLSTIRQLLTTNLVGKKCVGYQTLAVSAATALRLTVPAEAQSAEITVEASGSTNPSAAVRYTLDNSTSPPQTGAISVKGVPIGEYDTIEIINHNNLNAFQVVAADGVNTKYLKINYFA